MVDCGVDLVDAVNPAVVGVEGDVAWAGTGTIVAEELRVRDFAGFWVDLEDSDVVGAKVADEEEAVVRRDGGAVRVGGILTGNYGAECAKLLVIFKVDAIDWLAEGAIGLDAIGGYGTRRSSWR